MTRMIERWFPCAEVSRQAAGGWGSGNSETNLFTWFAKRPLAQAKAAVLTSLLPWPDTEAEQQRLRTLVSEALGGYAAAQDRLLTELRKHYPDDPRVLDPFCGRGILPLEAARLQARAFGIDYAHMATLGARLLTDFPMRDWSREPELPYDAPRGLHARLYTDAAAVINEVGLRFHTAMTPFYPQIDGRHPWGYLWAISLPCQECGRVFPLVGNLLLRAPNSKKNDPGQSFRISVDRASGTCTAVVHDGLPTGTPTRRVANGKSRYDASGKVAVCPFCEHVHPKDVHTRLAASRLGVDTLLIAADLDKNYGKTYRTPTDDEIEAATLAANSLEQETPFGPGLPAVPDERIPDGNTWTVQATVYGARAYGDMCNARQTLGFVAIARAIADVGQELLNAGVSVDYAHALCGYASAVMVRKLRRATRGSTLDPRLNKVNDVFATESSLSFSYDYFEVGLGDGPGGWASVKSGTLSALQRQLDRPHGRPATIERGSATTLAFRTASMDAVITDPPYDAMIDYSDASDLFFVWLKRSMSTTWPEVSMTADPRGLQEKTDEIIVKKGGTSNQDHRDRDHYDRLIAEAFSEARRVVTDDGVVTIVFGHGDPVVWRRLLGAVTEAGLVLTGSWPARTEPGGKTGFANIVTTLTMSCRPAPSNRPCGRKAVVEREVKDEVKSRMSLWERSGLAPTDMLMASAGPAMEVVGRYSEVLDAAGEPVNLDTFLPLARKAVQEAAALRVDRYPLDAFDARTQFALWWVRLFGRQLADKSELRWETLAASLDLAEVRDLVPPAGVNCRFVKAEAFTSEITPASAVIDVALAMAKAWPEGLDAVGEVLAKAGRETEDPYLWATLVFLVDRLPDVDPDVLAWNGLLRNRRNVSATALDVRARARADAELRDSQPTLF